MMKKRLLLFVGAALALIAVIAIFAYSTGNKETADVIVPVKRGKLEITVATTGELQALNSEDIKGPFGLQQIGVYQMKITDLVPEGTVVKAGDYIATLDRSDISGKMKELSTELSKIESQYLQTRLDTALEMRKLRDELINQKYALEEKKIILDQSKYEPPAVIRQAEIDLEKTKRAYEQAQENYKLKLQQNRAKMQEVAATLNQQQGKLEQMNALMAQFVINAPKGGMLIYRKDWNGRKIETGSTINVWNPAVATLPDLSTMVSKTYVNEIDISKVKKGQKVVVSVDAFPDKKYSGEVINVANIGEQLPKTQTKVFEVSIEIKEGDTLLRPAMTSSNTIYTNALEDVLYLPIDAVRTEDKLKYVYKANSGKLVKQEILLGAMSTDMAEIKAGLEEGDEVYLSTPADTTGLQLVALPDELKLKTEETEAPLSATVPKQEQALQAGEKRTFKVIR